MSDNDEMNSPAPESADLENTGLGSANPGGADLEGTDLERADLESADGALEVAPPAEVLTPEEKKQRERREIFRAFGLLSQVGVTMLVCVALGLLFGWTLDKLLGSAPWLLVFGAFLGGGAAIKVMYDIGTRG